MTGPLAERPSTMAAAVGAIVLATLVAPVAAAPPAQDDECSRTFALDGPRLYLPASEDATVEGTIDPASGTDVSVLVSLDGEASPQVAHNDSVVVDDHGNWRATVDLSGVEEGRTFTATLRRDGGVVEAVDGEVGNASATVTFENQTAAGTPPVVTVRRVHLDLGGFVAFHRNESRGPIVGFSDYLAPGTHENVTVELLGPSADPTTLVALAHYDSNCDRAFSHMARPVDGPYGTYAFPFGSEADAATVQFPTPTSSPSLTATITPTATQTLSPTRTPDTPATTTAPQQGTTTTGPGFGIGATLVAVVGGTVLLWRRR